MKDKRRFEIFAGYFGGGNIGDELILKFGLDYKDKDKIPCVISSDPWRTRDRLCVKSIHKYNLPSIIYCMFKASRVIFPGGGIFQDMTSTRSLYYYLMLVVMARIAGAKVEMYGMGLGPFVNYFNRIVAVNILKGVHRFEARDKRSLSYLGAPSKRFTLGEDTVLKHMELLPRSSRKSAGEKHIVIGINLRPWHNIKRVIKEVGIGLSQYTTDRGIKFLLIPFSNADEKPLRRLVQYLNSDSFIVETSPENAIKVLANCDAVIGMRLHFNLMAHLLGIPSLTLAYDRKCRDAVPDDGERIILGLSRLSYMRFSRELEKLISRVKKN